jgi:uncharacterized damage-inducible protein DinB
VVSIEEFLHEPSDQLSDQRELLIAYLDAYRDAVLRKLAGLSEADLSRSAVPSGWTPIELLNHLAFVERRWLQWGFRGEDIEYPWGDSQSALGRWSVPEDESAEIVRGRFEKACERSREIVSDAQLSDKSRWGGRFTPEQPPPTLGWILFHLLQEYARHLGHLDIARELIDGAVGE